MLHRALLALALCAAVAAAAAPANCSAAHEAEGWTQIASDVSVLLTNRTVDVVKQYTDMVKALPNQFACGENGQEVAWEACQQVRGGGTGGEGQLPPPARPRTCAACPPYALLSTTLHNPAPPVPCRVQSDRFCVHVNLTCPDTANRTVTVTLRADLIKNSRGELDVINVDDDAVFVDVRACPGMLCRRAGRARRRKPAAAHPAVLRPCGGERWLFRCRTLPRAAQRGCRPLCHATPCRASMWATMLRW